MSTPFRLPKILGADVELGNFVTSVHGTLGPRSDVMSGVDAPRGTGALAARLLLREIEGVASGGGAASRSAWDFAIGGANPQDQGRRFLPENGGCVYVDLDHFEIALPETRSAYDAVAQWRAMLGLAAGAAVRANRCLPPDHRLQVLANCSDGLGNSYGSHVSVMLTHEAWQAIVARKPHYLAYLAAFQISGIVITGQGKVGSENGQSPVPYQISQRADFFETMIGEQTTYRRPIVNTRDEPLCGPRPSTSHGGDPARLHVIFFDSTLCDVASLLRFGTLQIVVAMIEAGQVDRALALDDPLDALGRWSRDPSLETRALTIDGNPVTAVQMQWRFLEAAKRFADRGGFDDIVPRADEILTLWEGTLSALAARDMDTLGRRLDWVLKRRLLQRVIAQRPSLSWDAPQLKHLDLLYASIDPNDGLHLACERDGLVDRVVTADAVARAAAEPPNDTRAFARAHLLRSAGADAIDRVNWDEVVLWVRDEHGRESRRLVRLDDPAATTGRDEEHLVALTRATLAVGDRVTRPLTH